MKHVPNQGGADNFGRKLKKPRKYAKISHQNAEGACALEGPLVRCLMVETGMEAAVLQLLKVMRLGKGIYPQRVRIRKIRGVWRKDHIRLLPGYVFVFAEEEIPIWTYRWVPHVLKVLRYDREPDGYLRGTDLAFAQAVTELDGRLDILDAVDEEGFIRVTDRLLNLLHGEVLSVDRGKRQVRIRVNLVGQPRIVQMNYQLLDDEGKPLDPVTEMLDDEEDTWLTAWTPDFADDLAERMDGPEEAPEGPDREGRREQPLPETPGKDAGGEPAGAPDRGARETELLHAEREALAEIAAGAAEERKKGDHAS